MTPLAARVALAALAALVAGGAGLFFRDKGLHALDHLDQVVAAGHGNVENSGQPAVEPGFDLFVLEEITDRGNVAQLDLAALRGRGDNHRRIGIRGKALVGETQQDRAAYSRDLSRGSADILPGEGICDFREG